MHKKWLMQQTVAASKNPKTGLVLKAVAKNLQLSRKEKGIEYSYGGGSVFPRVDGRKEATQSSPNSQRKVI